MEDAVCLECERPIEADVEQRVGQGLRPCDCTTAELREALARAYTCISKQGEEQDSLAERCAQIVEARIDPECGCEEDRELCENNRSYGCATLRGLAAKIRALAGKGE